MNDVVAMTDDSRTRMKEKWRETYRRSSVFMLSLVWERADGRKPRKPDVVHTLSEMRFSQQAPPKSGDEMRVQDAKRESGSERNKPDTTHISLEMRCKIAR